MIQKYALPCNCGHSVPVEVRQAGDRVACPQCEQWLDVPRLRELKSLEVVSPDRVVPHESGAWSGLPGALFALGLLVCAIAAGSAYYSYATRLRYEEFMQPPEKIEFRDDIQQISLNDSWEAWSKLKDVNVASREQPLHVFAREKVADLNRWVGLFGVTAGLGLLSMASSFFFRPRKAA